jgi:hypothetical protein
MFRIFRNRPEHTRIPQHDSESDSDTLLPAPSSSTSLGFKAAVPGHSSRDARVAVKTLILCTIVYVGGAIWIAWTVNKSNFISDPDDFCIHHVSKYCTLGKLEY